MTDNDVGHGSDGNHSPIAHAAKSDDDQEKSIFRVVCETKDIKEAVKKYLDGQSKEIPAQPKAQPQQDFKKVRLPQFVERLFSDKNFSKTRFDFSATLTRFAKLAPDVSWDNRDVASCILRCKEQADLGISEDWQHLGPVEKAPCREGKEAEIALEAQYKYFQGRWFDTAEGRATQQQPNDEVSQLMRGSWKFVTGATEAEATEAAGKAEQLWATTDYAGYCKFSIGYAVRPHMSALAVTLILMRYWEDLVGVWEEKKNEQAVKDLAELKVGSVNWEPVNIVDMQKWVRGLVRDQVEVIDETTLKDETKIPATYTRALAYALIDGLCADQYGKTAPDNMQTYQKRQANRGVWNLFLYNVFWIVTNTPSLRLPLLEPGPQASQQVPELKNSQSALSRREGFVSSLLNPSKTPGQKSVTFAQTVNGWAQNSVATAKEQPLRRPNQYASGRDEENDQEGDGEDQDDDDQDDDDQDDDDQDDDDQDGKGQDDEYEDEEGEGSAEGQDQKSPSRNSSGKSLPRENMPSMDRISVLRSLIPASTPSAKQQAPHAAASSAALPVRQAPRAPPRRSPPAPSSKPPRAEQPASSAALLVRQVPRASPPRSSPSSAPSSKPPRAEQPARVAVQQEKSGQPQTIIADAAKRQDDASIVVQPSPSNLGYGQQLSMFSQRHNGAKPSLPDPAEAGDYETYDQVEGRPHDENISLNGEDQNTTNSVPSKATSSQLTTFQKLQELEREERQATANLKAAKQALQTANANARKITRPAGIFRNQEGKEGNLGEMFDFITGLDWNKAQPLQDENELAANKQEISELIGYLAGSTEDPQSKMTFMGLGNAMILFQRELHETAATLQAVDKERAALAKPKPRKSQKVRRKRSSSNKGEGIPNANPDEAAVQEEGATTQGLATEEGQQVLDGVPDDAAAQEDAVQVLQELDIQAAEAETLVRDAENLLRNAADAAGKVKLPDGQVHVPLLEKDIDLKTDFHNAMAHLLSNPPTVNNDAIRVIEAAAKIAPDDASKRNLEALLDSVTLFEQQKEALAKKRQEIEDTRKAWGKRPRKKPGKARITKSAVASKVVPGAAAAGKRGFLLEQLKKIPKGYTYALVPSINISRNAAAQEECETAVLVWRWQGKATIQVAKGALESCWTKFRRALCSAKPNELAFEVLLKLPCNTWDLVCKPSSFLEDREVATKQLEGIVRVLALDQVVRGEHEVQLPPAIKTRLLLTAHNMLFSGTVGAPLSEGLSLFLKYGRSPLTMQDQQFFRQYELSRLPETKDQYVEIRMDCPATGPRFLCTFGKTTLAFKSAATTPVTIDQMEQELLKWIQSGISKHEAVWLNFAMPPKVADLWQTIAVAISKISTVKLVVCEFNSDNEDLVSRFVTVFSSEFNMAENIALRTPFLLATRRLRPEQERLVLLSYETSKPYVHERIRTQEV